MGVFSDDQKKEFFMTKINYSADIFQQCPLFEKNSKGEDLFTQEEREQIYLKAVDSHHECIYYINDPNIDSDLKYNLFKIAIERNPVNISQIINPNDFSQDQLFNLYLLTIQKHPESFRSLDRSTLFPSQKTALQNEFINKANSMDNYRSAFIDKGNKELDAAFEFLSEFDNKNQSKKNTNNDIALSNIDWEFLFFLYSIIILTKSSENTNDSVSETQLQNISQRLTPEGSFNHNFYDDVILVNDEKSISLELPTYDGFNLQDWNITCPNNKISINNNVATIDDSINHGSFRIEAKNKKNNLRKDFVILYNLPKNELLNMFRNVLAHGMFYFKDLEKPPEYKTDSRECIFNIKIKNKRNELNALFGGQKEFKLNTLRKMVENLYFEDNKNSIHNMYLFSNLLNLIRQNYSLSNETAKENMNILQNAIQSNKENFKSYLALCRFYINFAYNYEYEKGRPNTTNAFYNGLSFQQNPYNQFTLDNEQSNQNDTTPRNAVEVLRTAIMHGWYDVSPDGIITIKYYSNTEPRVLEGTKQITAEDLLQLIDEKINIVKTSENTLSSK